MALASGVAIGAIGTVITICTVITTVNGSYTEIVRSPKPDDFKPGTTIT